VLLQTNPIKYQATKKEVGLALVSTDTEFAQRTCFCRREGGRLNQETNRRCWGLGAWVPSWTVPSVVGGQSFSYAVGVAGYVLWGGGRGKATGKTQN
jgi:hypothetical protein